MDWVLYWKSTKVKCESVGNETDISKLKQGVSFFNMKNCNTWCHGTRQKWNCELQGTNK